MGKNKLTRFAENATFAHLFQPTLEELRANAFALRGHWREHFRMPGAMLTLELGCGRGEYTVALAHRDSQGLFVGMDIKGARLWRGAKMSLEAQMPNVGFVRGRIETITRLFAPGEVDAIWLTFPDPRPKDHDAKRRLTHPRFLFLYQQLLAPGGQVHLKTDSRPLYDYTLALLQSLGAPVLTAFDDIDPHLDDYPLLAIPTRYEALFRAQGHKITYLAWQLPPSIALENEETRKILGILQDPTGQSVQE